MTYKMVAIDLDGTLLDDHMRILPETADTLIRARKRGVKIVLCSGRPLPAVRDYLHELGIAGNDQYVITNNGATLETAAGRTLANFTLTFGQVRALNAFAQKHHLQSNISTRDHIYTVDQDISWWTVKQAFQMHADLLRRDIDRLPTDVPIIKVMYIAETAAELDALEPIARRQFSPEVYFVRSRPQFLEAVHPAAGKGNALKRLTERLGLQAADVMAIGNERNDLKMIDYAGCGVAMANAVDSVRQQADAVTADNQHNGVGKIVKKYILCC
ncbi:MAG: Cof-type HAD-IIB family hydrolase [Sporolactobacillus sp.]|jgi:Cof subfamily protein (haloacid dehalogenase superfamily)|nr:Cof-type HAD-IIB family hydrolase [Sporolactobacillus sp.]